MPRARLLLCLLLVLVALLPRPVACDYNNTLSDGNFSSPPDSTGKWSGPITESSSFPGCNAPFTRRTVTAVSSEMTISFTGTAVYLRVFTGNNRGIVQIWLDEVHIMAYDGSTDTTSASCSIPWGRSGLDNRQHTLRIQLTAGGSRGGGLEFDFVDILYTVPGDNPNGGGTGGGGNGGGGTGGGGNGTGGSGGGTTTPGDTPSNPTNTPDTGLNPSATLPPDGATVSSTPSSPNAGVNSANAQGFSTLSNGSIVYHSGNPSGAVVTTGSDGLPVTIANNPNDPNGGNADPATQTGSSQGLPTAAIIGIVVAILVILLLLLLCLFIRWRRRRRMQAMDARAAEPFSHISTSTLPPADTLSPDMSTNPLESPQVIAVATPASSKAHLMALEREPHSPTASHDPSLGLSYRQSSSRRRSRSRRTRGLGTQSSRDSMSSSLPTSSGPTSTRGGASSPGVLSDADIARIAQASVMNGLSDNDIDRIAQRLASIAGSAPAAAATLPTPPAAPPPAYTA